MPAISVTRTAGAGTGSSFVVTPHPVTILNELFVTCIYINSTTATIATPTGWTSVYSNLTDAIRVGVFTRFSGGFGSDGGGTEPATTFTLSASVPYLVQTWLLRGANFAQPVMVAPLTASGTTGTALAAPSVTVTEQSATTMWFYGAYHAASATTASITLPAGLTYNGTLIRSNVMTGFVGITGGDYNLAAGVASGTRTGTSSVSGPWRTIGLSVREEPRINEHMHVVA